MRLRLLALALAVISLVGLGLTVTAPAVAAAKHAGFPNLTPYGGYLGNYLAPDGTRVYCIDSSLEWPSGATSAPSPVDSLTTTGGAQLSSIELQKLNYVLLKYGQTDDPVQAAAVAAVVNAYTSGWARDLGAGYAAGAWYLNGDATVTGAYDAIWSDAEANAAPTATATLLIDAAAGTVSVAASPVVATGTLTLSGAVRADTGESTFEVAQGEVVAIRGTPADDRPEYAIAADATFSAPTPAAPNLVLYTTPGQQRTIRGGTTGTLTFSASAKTEALLLDFTPIITTVVDSATVEVGQPLVDRVTLALAEGSRPWRLRADGTPVPVVAEGVLYGPFDEQPAQTDEVPPGAPVAAVDTLTFAGPGELATSGAAVATAPGHYTWVWSIDAATQDAVGAASLPEGYRFSSAFGIAEESHLVTEPPPRLPNTGSEPRDAGLVAGALVGFGALLLASSRGVLRVRRPSARAPR